MLAQVATDAAPWVGYGVAGILAWFLWYKTAVSDPRDRKEHRQQIEAIAVHYANERKEHQQQIETITAQHATTIGELKDEYLKVIKEVRNECKEERKEFLIELASERAIRAELEDKRQQSEQQRHADNMAMTQALNRLSEMVAQRDWNGPAREHP